MENMNSFYHKKRLLGLSGALVVLLTCTLTVTPALAATYSFPPYSGTVYIKATSSSNDRASLQPSSGGIWLLSQPSSSSPGTAYVYMASATKLCYTTSQTVTISGISANVKGFLMTGGSGESAVIQIQAYLGKANAIKDTAGHPLSTLLEKVVTNGADFSTNQVYNGPSKTFTVQPGEYRVVAYAAAQASGSTNAVSQFGNFGGEGYGITNYKVTLTAPANQC